MARITTVDKCRKAQGACGKCGDKLPKGSAYIHWSPGFRGHKRKRCTKPTCHPRPSEMTANGRLSTCLAAQENVEDVINGWDRTDVEALKEALTEAAESIREVGEEYQESADAINETAEGSPIAEECQEKSEGLSEWADTIESAADDLEEPEDDAGCDECGATGKVDCPDCDPSGSEEQKTKKSCETCDGTMEVDCEECDGEDKSNHHEEGRENWAQEQVDKAEEAMGECPI